LGARIFLDDQTTFLKEIGKGRHAIFFRNEHGSLINLTMR
jgi:hypothetical protein